MPLTTGPDMCVPGLPIANAGPSTPVKYDEDMKLFAPNQGVGRPGKTRLKKPPGGMQV